LAIDANGKIYVGTNNDFGYLKPLKNGEWVFESLKNQLPKGEQNFKEINKILISDKLMVVQTAEKLFIFQDQQWQVLKTGGYIDQTFLVNGQIYLREWGNGLLVLQNGILTKIAGSSRFAYDRVLAMIPQNEKKIWLLSRNQGMLEYHEQGDSLKTFKNVWSKDLNNYLVSQQITCAEKIDAQKYALGTQQNGLLILDNRGNVIHKIDQNSGLHHNSINDLFLDKFNNLWAGLENGICQVEIRTPFLVYNEKSGLRGSIINSIKHQNKLYVGTTEGIFYREWDKPTGVNFKQIPNTEGYVGVAYIFQNTLLYSHHNGVLIIEDTTAKTLIGNEAALAFSSLKRYPNLLLVAKLKGGLALLEKSGNAWKYKGDIKGLTRPCNSLVEDDEGNIWFSDYVSGIYKMRLNTRHDSVLSLKLYDQKSGLPNYSRNSIVKFKNRLVYITRMGVYAYHKKKDIFEPDQWFNRNLFGQTYVNSLVEDFQNNYWFLQFGKVKFGQSSNNRQIPVDTLIFNKLKVNVLTHITPIDSQNILFATQKGLFHFLINQPKTVEKKYPAFVRKVSVLSLSGRDSVIFAGTFMRDSDKAGLWQNKAQIPVLNYNYNNIRFHFSSVWFEDTQYNQYRFRLDGLDKNWSEWSSKSEKSYTNLPEGTYTFKVEAMNIYGQISQVGEYHFVILPPWYRNPWAYFLYFCLVLLAIYGLIRWNTWRLRKQNLYLAQQIQKGLAEIGQKNQELEQKNQEIEQAYQNVKLLSEMGQGITAQLTVTKIVDAVYENINQLMDAASFGIGIPNFQTQSIDFIGAKEEGKTLAPISFDMSDENRLAVWCFKHKQEIILNNYPKQYKKYVKEYRRPITELEIFSVIYLPLVVDNEAVGVITVQSSKANAYNDYHLNILKNLAIYTVIALENARAYQRLEELNQEKNYLIGVVAHDLRNPLHNIFGMANVIQLNSENLTDKQNNYLQKIIDSISRINLMINKILDMKAIESNQLNLQKNPLNLVYLLKQVVDSFREEAQRKNIQLHFSHQLTEYWVEVDENYTLQVYENLISNALKFSNLDAKVFIRLQSENGLIRTEIQDQGPGIPVDEQAKLFGKFQKLSPKPTSGEHSVGLGLSIVKKYVEAMEGKVWCESQPGEGATFIVAFNAFNFQEINV
jgi:signal transduction histidine kinase